MTSAEVQHFIASFQSLMMASLTPDNLPFASTAPFVQHGNHFYLLISTVAQHGRNLLTNPQVSLLFAEDEALCGQPFARKRITLEATSCEVLRENALFDSILDLFKSKFDPELITSLASMGDFHLFELTPSGGSAVMGFGKAFRLDENLEVITHITGHHQKGASS